MSYTKGKPRQATAGKEIKMMTYEEMKQYLLDELKEEHDKMIKKQGSNYSYIFMLCNDMGIREE